MAESPQDGPAGGATETPSPVAPPVAPASVPAAKTSPKPKKTPSRVDLPQFRVLLHNDDVNEMTYVVRTIVQLTTLNRTRATLVSLHAHYYGLALVMITHKERAELYQEQFRSKGLSVSIEPDQ